MKRYGVISDTHGDLYAIDSALRAIGDVDEYIHLGDIVSDAERIGDKTKKPVHAVLGNCDLFSLAKGRYTHELVLESEGAKLLLVHGHKLDIDANSTYYARERAEQLGCGALLYGHTHIPSLRNYGGLIVLNPGSPSRPRGGFKPSAAVIEIENGVIRAKLLPFE